MNVEKIIETIQEAFCNGEIEKFVSLFAEDLPNIYYIRRWFISYAIKFETPVDCNVSIYKKKSCIEYKLRIKLYFQNYDNEDLLLWIKFNSEHIERAKFSFVECEKYKAHTAGDKRRNLNVKLDTHKDSLDKEGLRYLRDARDPLTPQIYARAIVKSMRYRMSNYEINCAALLADIMSVSTSIIANETNNKGKKSCFEELIGYARNCLLPIDAEDVDVPINEKCSRSMRSIDEVLYEVEKKGGAAVNCIENISFFISMLYHLHILDDFYIIMQPFHFIAICKIEEKYYLISFNDVVIMRQKRIYGNSEVLRVFNEKYYFDFDSNATNMPRNEIQKMYAFFENFKVFPLKEGNQNKLPLNTIPFNINSAYFIKEIYRNSYYDPQSIYTWAKYSYQTLMVKKPQAFIISAFHSKKLQLFAAKIERIKDLIRWVTHYISKDSLFSESDRVMVPEQVFKYRIADAKSLAVFMYAVVYLNRSIETGGVVVTNISSYLVLNANKNYTIIDTDQKRYVDKISGQIQFAFNEKISYNVFFDEEDELENINWIRRKKNETNRNCREITYDIL